MPTMPLPPELSAPVGTDAVTVAPDSKGRSSEIQKSKKILRLLLGLAGGFFLCASLFVLVGKFDESGSLFTGIPNTAQGVFILGPSPELRASFARFEPALSQLNGFDSTALVILSSPIETGLLVRIHDSETLTKFATESKNSLTFGPVGANVIAIGSPSFIERVKQAPRVPWIVRLRLSFRLHHHPGAVLWSADQLEPWTIGSIEEKNKYVSLVIPSSSPISIEDLKQVMKNFAQELYPGTKSILLPDNSVAHEVKTDPLFWQSSTGGNIEELHVKGMLIFSIVKNKAKIPCFDSSGDEILSIFRNNLDKNQPLLSFSQNNDKITFCF